MLTREYNSEETGIKCAVAIEQLQAFEERRHLMSALHEFSVRYVTQRAEASLQCSMQLHIFLYLNYIYQEEQNYALYYNFSWKKCII